MAPSNFKKLEYEMLWMVLATETEEKEKSEKTALLQTANSWLLFPLASYLDYKYHSISFLKTSDFLHGNQ